MAGLKSLPVLMHHYISNHPNTIAVAPDLFRAQCRDLAEAGWRGISLQEAEGFLARSEPLPPRCCLITFDDGYLDNYVYAWPILAEFGHKGTIFAVTERINQASAARTGDDALPRSTIADVRDNTYPEYTLPDVDNPIFKHTLGFDERRDQFFTWAEARRMEESGVIQVAAHSMRHQSVFLNDTYSGFFMPRLRPRTFDRPRGFCWGMPRFTHRAGLGNRAFIPSDELMQTIHALVPQDEAGAYAFSQDAAAMAELQTRVAALEGKRGRLETDAEMRERMEEELLSGKTAMEKELGHTVETLCWPWGEYAPEARELGQNMGFTVFITTAYGANPPGKPLAVHRFKVKQKGGGWLLSRVRIFSRPILGSLYARCRL